MKILVVDDLKENRYLLESALKAGGYEFITAPNGYEALEILHTTPVDMIITDILMPRMDGFQLCRMVKSDAKLKDIPFIFYSAAYTTPEDQKFGRELGADRFIIKPIDPEEFLIIIGDILQNAGDIVPAAPLNENDSDGIYLEQYNRIIFTQIEKKIAQLEEKNRELVGSQTALEESEMKFHTLFNSISEAVFLHEIRPECSFGTISEVNIAACQMLGYPREELLKLTVYDINTPAVRKNDPGRFESLNKYGNLSFEAEMKKKNGSVFPVYVKVSCIEMGGKQYGISLVRDLTGEKESRRREAAVLKSIERNITQLAILNDEIRNPLTVISGLITFDESVVSKEILHQVNIINGIIKRLDQGWLESAKIREFLKRHHNFSDDEIY